MRLLLIALFFIFPAALPAQDLAALQKRIAELEQKLKDAELDKLKLRLNLADEKLVNQRFEFNMLVTERGRICNELSASDPKTHRERCMESK